MKHSMFLTKYKGTTYTEDINKSSVGLSSIYYWITGLTLMTGIWWTQKTWFSFLDISALTGIWLILRSILWVKGWSMWVIFLWRGNHSSQEKLLQLWRRGLYKPVLRMKGGNMEQVKGRHFMETLAKSETNYTAGSPLSHRRTGKLHLRINIYNTSVPTEGYNFAL